MQAPEESPSESRLSLADGHEVPRLGLGVWQIKDGTACVNAVRWAIEAGYRHIDTAQGYRNEESVGKAIKQSGVDRASLFITTKFNPSQPDPASALEGSLKRLGVEAVDLYLVHWPAGGRLWAWPGMERAHRLGHARSIGVSNFDVDELSELLSVTSDPPVVNQVQLNPFADRRALVDACRQNGLVLEAYSPLGTGSHLGDRTVGEVAAATGRTPAQVLLRWGLQRGFVVLPKSMHRDRIRDNAQIFDFELSEDQMATLDGLDRTHGTGESLERKWW